MRTLLLLIISCFLINPVWAQDIGQESENLRKNSIYAGILTLNYSRLFPLRGNTSLSLAGGLSFLDVTDMGPAIQIEPTLLFGKKRHFFEPGIMWWHDPFDDFVLVRMGYRFQHSKGFLFRVAPLFTLWEGENENDYNLIALPSLSLGYSF